MAQKSKFGKLIHIGAAVIAITAGLVYLFFAADLIPDNIPIVGFLDDVIVGMVIYAVWKAVSKFLEGKIFKFFKV